MTAKVQPITRGVRVTLRENPEHTGIVLGCQHGKDDLPVKFLVRFDQDHQAKWVAARKILPVA